MPTYDYKCDDCGHRYERFESITSKPNPLCPKCEKKGAKRLIGTGGGLIFKGSGFYSTDYRSKSYKDGAKSDGATAPCGASADKCSSCPANKNKS